MDWDALQLRRLRPPFRPKVFCRDMDWDALQLRRLRPPFRPKVVSTAYLGSSSAATWTGTRCSCAACARPSDPKW
ncbi:unnamed protein product [Arctia plantaginis]|nr:unnamed protein product [Arctia plantaginis]CAB3248577.1 unnamed protein product [Arctia plantaginis]CAB3248579.1 unnamed protein product [Arctia plantaginis]CAB3248581.1 unnamed protein product [Arctia plantaginis]CAB3249611.1 unnamed protein product [Arctia plantaginis]